MMDQGSGVGAVGVITQHLQRPPFEVHGSRFTVESRGLRGYHPELAEVPLERARLERDAGHTLPVLDPKVVSTRQPGRSSVHGARRGRVTRGCAPGTSRARPSGFTVHN